MSCLIRDEAVVVNVEAVLVNGRLFLLCAVDTKHPHSYKRMDTDAFQLPYQFRFSAVRMQGLFPVNSHLSSAANGL
jgi:hypothetical protein